MTSFMSFLLRHISILILCILGIYGLNYYSQSDRLHLTLAENIQSSLESDVKLAHAIIKSSVNLENNGYRFGKKGIKYLVYEKKQLVCWNDHDLVFENDFPSSFATIDNQSFYIETITQANKHHILFFPISGTISHFASDRSVTIYSPDKKQRTIIQLHFSFPVLLQWMYFLLYCISIIAAIAVLKSISVRFLQDKEVLTGLVVFTGGVFLARLALLLVCRTELLPQNNLFGTTVKPSLLSPTLIDLLINILLLCVLVWFIRSYIKPHYFTRSSKHHLFIAVLNYFLVNISAMLMIGVFRQLVLSSGISFDFEYVFYLDLKSFIALIGILVLSIALFMLDLHILRIIRRLGLSIEKRLIANSIALLVLVPLLYFKVEGLQIEMILAIAGYLTLLDLSIDYFKPKPSWYLIWTLTGAVLISSLLYQFHTEKDLFQRAIIVGQLKEKLNRSGLHHEKDKETLLKQSLLQIISSSPYLTLYEINHVPSSSYSRHSSAIDPHHQLYLTKKSNPVFKILSFFSYIFILFNVLLILFNFLNSKLKWFAFPLFTIFPSNQTLRYRIQTSMLYMSICSFVLIAFVIIFYIKQNQSDSSELNSFSVNRDAYNIYNEEGLMLPLQNARMNYQDWAAIHSRNQTTHIQTVRENNRWQYLVPDTEWIYLQTKRRLNDFLGALLNVYVFLLLGIIIISMLVANSITKPLTVLSLKLKQIQIGGSNQKLEWNRQDELGGLIRNYNEMIHELDRSTRLLALTERETAWREMAKQVAHEIKNPLTPMKLITQHLQNSISRAEPEEVPALVKRVTTTLIEQIENLSKIASEFSNFAKLPAPENEKIILNEIVTSTHDLFRKREDMDIHLRVPIDEIYVFADKNHIIRVLTNLVKNAIQAIPLGRRGRIEIILYKQYQKAIVKVTDNGCGIPDSMKDKVFYPNFTTKNSGTGLGLAIVRDIIESSQGHIYFNTKENIGTEFYVELPLMRMEDNFREVSRVSL